MQSSNEQTVQDVAQMLAKRAAFVETFPEASEKVAFDIQGVLSSIGEFAKNNPTATAGAGGALAGGLAGFGSSYMQDEDDRQPMQSALTGALAGGMLGAGGMAAYKNWPGDIGKIRGEAGKPNIGQAANDMSYQSFGVPSVTGTATAAAATGVGAKGLHDSLRNPSDGASLRRAVMDMKPNKSREYLQLNRLRNLSDSQLSQFIKRRGATGPLNSSTMRQLVNSGRSTLARNAPPGKTKALLGLVAALGGLGMTGESMMRANAHNRNVDNQAKGILEQYAKAGE